MAEGGGVTQANDANPATRDVFISYASQDAAVATLVVEALEHMTRLTLAPLLAKLRGDQRLKALVRKMPLPE